MFIHKPQLKKGNNLEIEKKKYIMNFRYSSLSSNGPHRVHSISLTCYQILNYECIGVLHHTFYSYVICSVDITIVAI